MSKTLGSVMLNPNDPFEKLLITIVELNRKKRADYANDDNIYLNFDRVSDMTGYEVQSVLEVMIGIKTARIRNLVDLEDEGKLPSNEGLIDSRLDRATYCILDYGIALRDQEAS